MSVSPFGFSDFCAAAAVRAAAGRLLFVPLLLLLLLLPLPLVDRLLSCILAADAFFLRV